MKDMRIYDKYLNMKPKEKKKIDFKVRFDSKGQKIGVILFAIGLVVLSLGFFLLFFKHFDDKVVPDDSNVVKNVNIKDFEGITTADGIVKLATTKVTFDKKNGVSEMTFVISSSEAIDELPFKVIFDLNGEQVVIADYLSGLEPGVSYEVYKQSNYDLTTASSWSFEKTTKEDLQNNYGMYF